MNNTNTQVAAPAAVKKPVEGFPGYFVTSDGVVFGPRFGDRRPVKTPLNNAGYKTTSLSCLGKLRCVSVHRLVAEAFCAGSGTEVNHKNGIKTDNRAENLEWTDRSGNQLHAHVAGLKKSGEQSHLRRKLFTSDVRIIRNLRVHKQTLKQIADAFGISESFVWKICNNQKWKHV